MRGIYIGLWFSFLVASSFNYPRDSDFQPLSWNLRIKVALGAAKGLAYLHSPESKLSDFGLARDGPADGKSHVSTRVMGTYGCAALEYMVTVSKMIEERLASDLVQEFVDSGGGRKRIFRTFAAATTVHQQVRYH
ncbi:hypothetical protein RJ640_003058 [Escallonia rubra]|uniref:Uncharacterized protein n=1 Tax=Escallonia rubra TaxID=112253 RepID=A0AA88RC74_9ASTE|nr:hypothetical protein RJ640_003058 [Escallonia rubra]